MFFQHEVISFQNHCIMMARELTKRPPVTMTESVLVYSALKDWMDFIADLDKVIDSLREEEELYFG